jgi:DNA-binding NarL/FixJ family response regulator
MNGDEMHEGEDAGSTDGEDIRVVVVDDHSMVADALGAVVNAQAGMILVGTADDIDHAWAVVEREHPHVVLMDYNLPSGDGVTCAGQMKTRHPDLRILILTGDDTDDVVTRAITDGCDGFLRKTTGMKEMVDAIRRAHAGEAVFSPTDLTRAVRQVRSGHPPSDLSARELEVLRGLVDGRSTAEIGEQLFISVHTVRSHVRHILEKLDAHSKLQAVTIALRDGIIDVQRP